MARYIYAFPLTDCVRIPGIAHGLHTPFLSAHIYERQGEEWCRVGGVQPRVHAQTYDVTIVLVQAISGILVLSDGDAT
jgi:hypothetical protein